ncbi:ABC transporter substrate-binding protein [Roseicitreum antarcticum]|uniref:Peptide/nickel transport system substrate-binding protein n=1 Tax=Roseicitreum antarcticum TaxID=564137 RepID=A0A1H3DDA7_9RHOB|nr:ABC transporter substrate-binding protein [Roseicitreum antarcticum]SDX64381.1 peptide/nickel transport system substrate-binding protein [Roseicitreum antarcticum]
MPRLHKILTAGAASLAMGTGAFAQAADDTIVVGLSADITTFEPAAISSRDNSNIARHIFGTLFSMDGDGVAQPDLANTLEISEDGLAYVYTLNEGLTCHDGEALTAEDAAYSFNRAADPENAFTGNTPGFVFSSIGFESAEALDELRVQINIAQKSQIAFGLIAEVFIHCMDSYEAMSLDEASSNPVGSGDYQITNWSRGSEVVLEAVEGAEVGFERIVWRIIPEASTRAAELMAGNVDIITNVAPDQLDVINNSGTAVVEPIQGTRRMYVGFNLSEAMADMPGAEAIANPDVRRALQYAVNVPGICTQLLNFECERMTGIVNPPNANQSLEPYPYDPEMAEQLLDEAGWPRGDDGTRFSIRFQAGQGRYLNDANVVQAVTQFLTDVGIDVELELMEWSSVFVPLIRERNAGPLFFLGSGGALWSPLYDMADLSTVSAGTNYTHWDDPRWFDRWADIAAAETEEETRVIIDEMLQVFYDDGPWLHMYFQPDFYGVSNRVNWQPRPDEKVYLFSAGLN